MRSAASRFGPPQTHCGAAGDAASCGVVDGGPAGAEQLDAGYEWWFMLLMMVHDG